MYSLASSCSLQSLACLSKCSEHRTIVIAVATLKHIQTGQDDWMILIASTIFEALQI